MRSTNLHFTYFFYLLTSPAYVDTLYACSHSDGQAELTSIADNVPRWSPIPALTGLDERVTLLTETRLPPVCYTATVREEYSSDYRTLVLSSGTGEQVA